MSGTGPKNFITELPLPPAPNRRRYLHPCASTRLIFERKENEARDVCCTPHGLSIDSLSKIQYYIRDVKRKSLIYKSIFLEFKDWLPTHGSLNERDLF